LKLVLLEFPRQVLFRWALSVSRFKVSAKKQISNPTIRTSFPHASGGNPGVLKTWTPRQKHAGVTGRLALILRLQE
jgi:hypothetical protein